MNRNNWFVSLYRRLIVRHFRDKLLAVVLALMLYSATISSGMTFQVAEIPVKLILPEKMVLRNTELPTIAVRLSAPPALHEKMNNRNILCTVEVPADSPSGQTFEIPLSEANFQLPAGAVVRRIVPDRITVNLESVVVRNIPIEAQVNPDESPAPGYQVATVHFTPETVQVSGPASLVGKLKAVQTAPIPLDKSIDENFQYTVPLRNPGGTVTLQPATVMASVVVERDNDRHTVRGLPLRIIPGRRMEATLLTPGTMRLEVVAPPSELAKLSSSDFLVYLDLTDLAEPGEYDVAPRAVTASGTGKVRIESISPNPVRVRIRKLSDHETGSDNLSPVKNN